MEGDAKEVEAKKISDIHAILKDKIANYLGFTGNKATTYAD
jgi:hypothetical protein